MDNYCKVLECPLSNTHVTKGHLCQSCGNFGHGKMECEIPILTERLKRYWDDMIEINDRCKFNNCNNKSLHTTEGHLIQLSLSRYKKLKCPLCRTDNKVDIMQKKISGLSDECCICMDNKVEIYFNDCGHVCLCSNCFDDI
jgi:hypothetical protein